MALPNILFFVSVSSIRKFSLSPMIRFIAVASLSVKVLAEMTVIRSRSDIVLKRSVKIHNYSLPYDLMQKQ